MDPNVQVAIATVVGTAITTLGVVVVALIQSRKGSGKDSDDSGDKEKTGIHAYIQALVLENARYQRSNHDLREKVKDLTKERDNLQAENEDLKKQLGI